MSSRPLPLRLGRRGAEDVGTEVVNGDLPVGCVGDGQAVMSRHWASAIGPLPHNLLAYIDFPSQGGLAAARFDSAIDVLGIHGIVTIALLLPISNSFASIGALGP